MAMRGLGVCVCVCALDGSAAVDCLVGLTSAIDCVCVFVFVYFYFQFYYSVCVCVCACVINLFCFSGI